MSWLTRGAHGFHKWMQRVGFSKDWFLLPLAAVIGVFGGLVATGFSWMVHEAGSLFFGVYGRQMFPMSTYFLLVALPAVGGLAVGLIQTYVSRTGPSHGIPEVIEALARRNGVMPLRMGLFKTVTSSLTIGSGGSGGVEGTIIQVGSVLGSVFGQGLRVAREHMNTLVGCGAAAGMAGIFNAPIAAVMFVLEVMLRDFSFKTFIPVVVASVCGTAIAQHILGQNTAIFNVPEAIQSYEFALVELGPYALLGILCGVIGVAFIFAEHYSEALWSWAPGPVFAKPAMGAGALGIVGVIFVLIFGNPVTGYTPPPFYANGYPVTEAMLDPASYGGSPESAAEQANQAAAATAVVMGEDENQGGGEPGAGGPVEPIEQVAEHHGAVSQEATVNATVPLLLGLVLFKLIGSAFTMGSGGSGGFIAPSLFIGAAAGGAFAMSVDSLGLFPIYNPATYALAGMAGVIAATVHAPLTAFLLVFEITQDYKIIVPVMLVSIIATSFAQFMHRDSIYTGWLRRQGVRVGSHADMTLLRRMTVEDVPLTPAVMVQPDDPAARLIELAEDFAAVDYVVCDDEECYAGMVVGEDVRTTLIQREAIPLMIVGELMRSDLPTVDPTETLDAVLDKFSRHEVSSLAVVDGNSQVTGVISRSRLMRQYHQALAAPG